MPPSWPKVTKGSFLYEATTSLWRFPDPPENSGDDLQRLPGAQGDGFVFAVLWLENVGVIVAPEARYRQALIFVPRDDDFPMEFAHIRIGRIDGNYKSILNPREPSSFRKRAGNS
jgi:hypothetical protein